MKTYTIENFESNTTQHLSCREGDVFAWVTFLGNPLQGNVEYDIGDLWVMNSGDFVTLTIGSKTYQIGIAYPREKLLDAMHS